MKRTWTYAPHATVTSARPPCEKRVLCRMHYIVSAATKITLVPYLTKEAQSTSKQLQCKYTCAVDTFQTCANSNNSSFRLMSLPMLQLHHQLPIIWHITSSPTNHIAHTPASGHLRVIRSTTLAVGNAAAALRYNTNYQSQRALSHQLPITAHVASPTTNRVPVPVVL